MADRFSLVVQDELKLFPLVFRNTDKFQYLQKFLLSIREEVKVWETYLDSLVAYRSPETVPEASINHLAYERGIPRFPDFVSLSKRRKLLRELTRFYKRKGLLDAIKDGIRLLSDLNADVYAPYADPNVWELGVDELGVGTVVGIPYRPGASDALILGESLLGYSILDEGPINQDLVYTFIISLNYNPAENDLLAVIWITELLKRAVDHYIIQWPAGTAWWYVGYSRVEISTRVGADSWEVGSSLLGISTIIGEEDPTPAPPFSIRSTLGTNTWVPYFGDASEVSNPIVPSLF